MASQARILIKTAPGLVAVTLKTVEGILGSLPDPCTASDLRQGDFTQGAAENRVRTGARPPAKRRRNCSGHSGPRRDSSLTLQADGKVRQVPTGSASQ